MSKSLERYRHDDKDANGKYRKSALCDACNKPVGTAYFTDDEVCNGSDGPGFYLCERKRCPGSKGSVEARRALYFANRAARNDGDPYVAEEREKG